MKFYAHTKSDGGEENWQPLEEHLTNVAELCLQFSAAWCSNIFSRNIGLLHDIGKYQHGFQERLKNSSIKIEHSFCGAKECIKYSMPVAACYCIAGHHGGLPDIGTPIDRADEGTLYAALKRIPQDYSSYISEVLPQKLTSDPMLLPHSSDILSAKKQLAFWIRMMFSSLVDADFLDTERFCKDRERSFPQADFKVLSSALESRLASFPCVTDVQKARRNLLEQAMLHASDDADIYMMNMPTGSGKTLTSMSFALEACKIHNLKRIIYVIPYTSIIEQNARVFRDIFGEDMVLEHHCNFDYNSTENIDTAQKLALAMENWDFPIIVTTNVQFFESIYGNRPSQMRKLHNIAQSVIVFDEAHMFPSLFYQPCLEAIKFLVKDYGCKALFLSATLPDFKRWMNEFGCNGLSLCDVIDDKSSFKVFERCSIENLGVISKERLLQKATEHTSALIVVNTRKTARELYNTFSGEKYHLSTYMTKIDRSRVIEKVKEALTHGRKFLLVSTSLIEAGVDLDFEVVFREMAGLDNIVQTAGRCNREGRRSVDKSHAYVFVFEEDSLKSRDKRILPNQYICNDIMQTFGTTDKAIRAYFDRVFAYGKDTMSEFDFAGFITPYGYRFASYAERFRIIDNDSQNVIVVYPDDPEQSEILSELDHDGRKARRRLQQYAVTLKAYEFDELFKQGMISQHDGLNFLNNFAHYNIDTGISLTDNTTYIF